MSLKQRVPLSTDAQGKPLFITIEWLKDLQALVADANPDDGTVTRAEFDSLVVQVNGFSAAITALGDANTALAERIKALEGGYQS